MFTWVYLNMLSITWFLDVSSAYRYFFLNEVPKMLYLSWPANDGDKLNYITIPNHLLVKVKIVTH